MNRSRGSCKFTRRPETAKKRCRPHRAKIAREEKAHAGAVRRKIECRRLGIESRNFAKIEYRMRWVADFEIITLANALDVEAPALMRQAIGSERDGDTRKRAKATPEINSRFCCRRSNIR